MISEINYTLLSDGSSDKALMPIIEWTLLQLDSTLLIQGIRADLTSLKHPPKSLTNRINVALRLYPCDLLFIHRDSEKESLANRSDEIDKAVDESDFDPKKQIAIPVIPVRMMEAWLLIDEQAIRIAAGNPNSRHRPVLPNPKTLESLPDPKSVLQDHLRQASGLKGRQLDRFNVGKAVHLVAQNVLDFSILKQLSAYQNFEDEVRTKLSL